MYDCLHQCGRCINNGQALRTTHEFYYKRIKGKACRWLSDAPIQFGTIYSYLGLERIEKGSGGTSGEVSRVLACVRFNINLENHDDLQGE